MELELRVLSLVLFICTQDYLFHLLCKITMIRCGFHQSGVSVSLPMNTLYLIELIFDAKLQCLDSRVVYTSVQQALK